MLQERLRLILSKTSALYKSFTYLLTYLHFGAAVLMAAEPILSIRLSVSTVISSNPKSKIDIEKSYVIGVNVSQDTNN